MILAAWAVQADESFRDEGSPQVNHYFAWVFPCGDPQRGKPCGHKHRETYRAAECGERLVTKLRMGSLGREFFAPLLSPRPTKEAK